MNAAAVEGSHPPRDFFPGEFAANRVGDVETISSCDARTFQNEIVPAHRPVVFKGLMREQPAFEKWSFEALGAKLADRSVWLNEVDGSVSSYDRELVEMNFAKFISELQTSPPPPRRHYLTEGVVLSDGRGRRRPILPELAKDLINPSIIPATPIAEGKVWLGFDGIITPLHFDTQENLLGAIQGKKHLALFPGDQTPYLYPRGLRDMSHQSQVDLEKPDLRRFPLLQKARYWTASLEPGDMLFLPSGWWHHVRSEGLNIAFNFWWSGSAMRYLTAPQNRVLAGGILSGRIVFKLAAHLRFKLHRPSSGVQPSAQR